MEKSIPEKLDLPSLEERILAFWKTHGIFQKTLVQNSPRGRFIFFEGPPTANGMPGLHHILPRIFKDAILRFRSMQGYLVDRKAGWDTHGLPTELQVQKELGIVLKREIEQLKETPKQSIAYFNEKCREAVWRYKDAWEKFTERMGFWLDMEHAYITCESDYIESLWWIIENAWENKFLFQDYKVIHYCPNCVTVLSSHEVAQGYETVKEDSVYVRFPLSENTFFLVWTTTPWTLVGNVALAIGPEIEYVKVQQRSEEKAEYLILSQSRLSVLKGDYEIVESCKGKELLERNYQPLYDFFTKTSHRGWYLVPGDFVTTDDGTGIVHLAWYGEEDYSVIKERALPWAQHINNEGRVIPDVERWQGMWFKDLDKEVMNDLSSRGLLYAVEPYEHEYPFCWRCHTPLLYHATTSWFIRMTALREQLIAANSRIFWVPDEIKRGRFGEWLENVKDWSISRERYWGTPLPIWECADCGERLCIGSRETLRTKAGDEPRNEKGEVDLHRPFIDAIVFACKKCNAQMRRVPEVLDAWFDSGAMPFAQWHYPFENRERVEGRKKTVRNDNGEETQYERIAFPADYISEAIDQTRGWFYTLLATSVFLQKCVPELAPERVNAKKTDGSVDGSSYPPYKNVICLGHIRDKFGKKMSKSKGNVVNPWEVFERYGSDALRFHLFTINAPGEYKDFDILSVDKVFKRVFLILWNVLSFYETYQDPLLLSRQSSENIMDKWILAEMSRIIKVVTNKKRYTEKFIGLGNGLENYDLYNPARVITDFIDELSTWYVRRSRSRFKGEDMQDKAFAVNTLRTVLFTLSKLMAPFTPFFAEELFQRLKLENDLTESVHLASWPEADPKFDNESLVESMNYCRLFVSKILEKRAEAGIPVRQTLASCTLIFAHEEDYKRHFQPYEGDFKCIIAEEINVQEVKVQIGGVDSGEEFSFVLDTTITPELEELGLVRELTRQMNALRKQAGLTIHDIVDIYYDTSSERLMQIIKKHEALLRKQTLALSLQTGNISTAPEKQVEVEVRGEKVWLGIR